VCKEILSHIPVEGQNLTTSTGQFSGAGNTRQAKGLGMDKEQLKRLKKELDAEIRKMGNLDQISQEKLERLVSFIDMELENPNGSVHPEHLVEHLEDSIQHFEVSHRDLTTAMNNIMVMLGNLGM
jgi:hypothetical protein